MTDESVLSKFSLEEHGLRADLLHPKAWHKQSTNVYVINIASMLTLTGPRFYDAETLEQISSFTVNKRHRMWRYPIR